MPIRNANWYNHQATRRYPLDDNATGTGDDGTRINDDVIVDCHLRWPAIAGKYAYVGGITVTDKIVTVVILAADSVDSATVFTPLAAVSLPQPVNPYVHYAVEALYPGVGGFLVFEDTKEPFSIRFKTPRQGLLSPKCGRPYQKLPIPTLRKEGRAIGLQDLVKILAGPDLEIVKELVTIGGVERPALILRLVRALSSRNVYASYIGPCALRPESRNCNKEGIETVNGAAPDCDGNLTIEFVGMDAGPYASCGSAAAGVTLDQDLGLSEVCGGGNIDRFQGQDSCQAISSESSQSSSQGSQGSEGSQSSQSSQGSEDVPTVTLPYTADFNLDTDYFETYVGRFTYTDGDSPVDPGDLSSLSGSSVMANRCLTATSLSRRNVSALYAIAYDSSLNKRITTDVSLQKSGAQWNGGLVLNYHIAGMPVNPHVEYFLACLDAAVGKVRLLRYTGGGFIQEAAVALGAPVVFGDWYRIQAEVVEMGSQVAIAITVSGVTNHSWPEVTFSIMTNKFLPADGIYGVGSDSSYARFSYFTLENINA